MENPRENLFFEPKNGYDRIDTDERIAMEAYCSGYMDFLNEARTEREAVRYAVAKAKENGFKAYEPGMQLQAGDRIYRINRGKALNRCLGETARNIFVYGLTVAAGLLLS